ncbi:MAG TPA: hypothetical protein ENI34_10395 [candidate division WOR-3 bacterium]|uniref:DUF7689 domain-containing protein n=1 Tax=candidate division WOR-3 bacterium TaxID=2052148 RepID=A0A9C9K0V8_UNCW3|nr:hypothetical protein [candidate division WOR-3 bacterium]
MGIIYADRFMIKEGEYLPDFIGPRTMEDKLRGVRYTMTYGGGQEQWIEEYAVDSRDYAPGMHTFKAEGWGGRAPVYDSVSLCVFDFYIREHLVKKYFNPLKPDSARVVYQILPPEYADPEVAPSPIKMEVEIRDKDSVLVYGPRELTTQEQKYQLLWWDGKDNGGEVVAFDEGPYNCKLTVYYRETGVRLLWGCSEKTPLYPTEFNLIAYDYENNEVPDSEEVNPGVYVHFNLDNDNNSDNSIAGSEGRHPGGDYLEDGPVSGEDDLELVKIEMKPLLHTGRVELKRDNASIRVWSSSNKGADKKVLYDNDVKSWNLAIPSERQEFENLKENLWVEGLGYNAEGHLFIWYYDASGTRWTGDLVKYTFIAADCGRQPRTEPEAVYFRIYNPITQEWHWELNPTYVQKDNYQNPNIFPNLKGCEWSVTQDLRVVGNKKYSRPEYNCIAWSVGESNVWYNPNYIDMNYGNHNGIFEDVDMDSFYFKKKGWKLVTSGSDEEKAKIAKAMYYSYVGDWNYLNEPPPARGWNYLSEPPDSKLIGKSIGFHGARRYKCDCGAGKWIMYESKCGQGEKIEHIWNQLNGPVYGIPTRFYR